jgi:hypothetical protein
MNGLRIFDDFENLDSLLLTEALLANPFAWHCLLLFFLLFAGKGGGWFNKNQSLIGYVIGLYIGSIIFSGPNV